MLYALLILLAAFIALLLLNVRVRFQLSDSKKLLFVGLGRSGPEFDFSRNVGIIKLSGIKLKSFDIGREIKEMPKEVKAKPKKVKAARPSKQRERSLRDLARVLPKCLGPMGRYAVSVLKAVIVEELEGQIEAGFDSPHVTGSVFGYYQAALAAAPGIVSRVQYVPDWSGASFGGSAKVSVAIPLYKLLTRTVILIYRLPLRDLIKLAIGKKKGVSDVQQRR